METNCCFVGASWEGGGVPGGGAHDDASLGADQRSGADWIVKDLRSVRFVGRDAVTGLVQIELCNTLVM